MKQLSSTCAGVARPADAAATRPPGRHKRLNQSAPAAAPASERRASAAEGRPARPDGWARTGPENGQGGALRLLRVFDTPHRERMTSMHHATALSERGGVWRGARGSLGDSRERSRLAGASAPSPLARRGPRRASPALAAVYHTPHTRTRAHGAGSRPRGARAASRGGQRAKITLRRRPGDRRPGACFRVWVSGQWHCRSGAMSDTSHCTEPQP